jgi:hypothetical protein
MLYNDLFMKGQSFIISRKNRPEQVDVWIRSGREVLPQISNLAAYSESWKHWWATLQPSERRDGESSNLKKVALGINSWAELRKGGINGFYSIISSLSWWLQAIDDSQQLQDFIQTLGDVSWALEQMVDSVGSEGGRKRSCDQSTAIPAKRSKRCVL